MISTPSQNGHRPDSGILRQVIEGAARATGASLGDLTVLATQHDPYRIDTTAGHRDGSWLAVHLDRALAASGSHRIHLRGLHYSIVVRGDVLKPNGTIYRNTDADWTWLTERAAKAARWLGHVPFEKIIDERNAPPVKYRRDRREVDTWISVGVDVSIPDADDLEPHVAVSGFVGRQPYHLVFFGEKSSLGDVLEPIARQFQADIYLPAGELTDTLIYEMARDAALDGRPMQVFTFSDCDPAGWQMVISLARKLQAFRDFSFPRLEFAVRPVALTPEQVQNIRLPSTPLKDTELRADAWRQAFGIEQTEIDALATLQPRVLTDLARRAVVPFYDAELDGRVRRAERVWMDEAQATIAEQSDGQQLIALRETAIAKLAEIEEEIAALNDALRQAVPDDIDLPAIEIPEPEVDETLHGKPLISSGDPWAVATHALIDRKRYVDEGGRGRR